MKRLEPCCGHTDHARPWRNERGWILTGLADDPTTWEAWLPDEWELHCAAYTPEVRRRNSDQAMVRHHRRRAA